jgi:hypothetical protein
MHSLLQRSATQWVKGTRTHWHAPAIKGLTAGHAPSRCHGIPLGGIVAGVPQDSLPSSDLEQPHGRHKTIDFSHYR